MRTITDEQKQALEDLSAEGLLRGLPIQTAEKDIQLVFVGGTCLSKAYGLINRMSEDIDIKVVMRPPVPPLKKGPGDRARLKALHEAVTGLLQALGFPLVEQARACALLRFRLRAQRAASASASTVMRNVTSSLTSGA